MLKIEVNSKETHVQMSSKDSEFIRWRDASNAIVAIIEANTKDAENPEEKKKAFCKFLKDTVDMRLNPSKKDEFFKKALSEIDTSDPMGFFLKALGEALLEIDPRRKNKAEESENEK